MQKISNVFVFLALLCGLWIFIGGLNVDSHSIAEKQADAELAIIHALGHEISITDSHKACSSNTPQKGSVITYCFWDQSAEVVYDTKILSTAAIQAGNLHFDRLVRPFTQTNQKEQVRRAAVRHALNTLNNSLNIRGIATHPPLPPIAPPEAFESRNSRPSEHRALGLLILICVLACTLKTAVLHKVLSRMISALSRCSTQQWLSPSHAMLLLAALAATIIPFWVPLLPPATDLPQHLGQMFLLEETLAGHRPDLVVTPWYYPNTLIYLFLYGFWKIADPITAGRLILSFLAAAWVGGTYLLCHQRQRPIENWLIGIPLVFNFLFNWGLLNFLIGWPVFCIFAVIAGQPASRTKSLGLAVTALALYYAHALWFAMANVWVALLLLESPKHERRGLALPLLPAWLLALIWYPQLAAARKSSGVDTSMIWSLFPHQRLDPEYLVNSMLGSMHADIEAAYCLIIGIWLAVSIFSNRKTLPGTSDKYLLSASSLMLLGFWAFPNVYMNTIFFEQRWLPFGIALLLLALPAPKLPRLYSHTLCLGLLAVFATATCKSWMDWEEEQLDGFLAAVSVVGKGEHVLGLNLSDGSAFIKGRPGLQLFAYVEPLRGATPQFSFTEHYSGVVQFRAPPPPNPYQVWSPFQAKKNHARDFDKILINGNDNIHTFAKSRWGVVQVDNSRRSWRVYRNPDKPR